MYIKFYDYSFHLDSYCKFHKWCLEREKNINILSLHHDACFWHYWLFSDYNKKSKIEDFDNHVSQINGLSFQFVCGKEFDHST
jgi:hypothetical protein